MDYGFSLLNQEISNVIKISMAVLTGNFQEVKKKQELQENEDHDEFTARICEMIDEGMINEAENILLEYFDEGHVNEIICLNVYGYLNEKSDGFLEKNGYSREEILLGIKYVIGKKYRICEIF